MKKRNPIIFFVFILLFLTQTITASAKQIKPGVVEVKSLSSNAKSYIKNLSKSESSKEDSAKVGFLYTYDANKTVTNYVFGALLSNGKYRMFFAAHTKAPDNASYLFYNGVNQIEMKFVLTDSDSNFDLFIAETDAMDGFEYVRGTASYTGKLLLARYDESKGLCTETASIESVGNDVFSLDKQYSNFKTGDPIFSADESTYIGMYETNGLCITTDYLTTVLLDDSSEETTTEKPTQSETTSSSNETETTTKAADTSKTVTVIGGVIMAVVIVALIVLVCTKKKNDETDNISNSDIRSIKNSDTKHNRICIAGNGGQFNGKKFELMGTVVIGRIKEKCNICYPENEKGISGLHCKIGLTEKGAELVDLGSTYGTYLNGTKLEINVPVSLKYGDRFWLADEINSFIVCK